MFSERPAKFVFDKVFVKQVSPLLRDALQYRRQVFLRPICPQHLNERVLEEQLKFAIVVVIVNVPVFSEQLLRIVRPKFFRDLTQFVPGRELYQEHLQQRFIGDKELLLLFIRFRKLLIRSSTQLLLLLPFSISDLMAEILVIGSKLCENFLFAPFLFAGRVHLSYKVFLEVMPERP